MRYQISGKQIDVGSALQTHVQNELNTVIVKYAERPTDAHVIFSKSASEFVCEATIHLSTGLTAQAKELAGALRENDMSVGRALGIFLNHGVQFVLHMRLQRAAYINLLSTDLITHFVSSDLPTGLKCRPCDPMRPQPFARINDIVSVCSKPLQLCWGHGKDSTETKDVILQLRRFPYDLSMQFDVIATVCAVQHSVSGDAEIVAEIDPADVLVFHHFIRGARHQNLPVMQDIRAIHDFERFAHIVIGDQHADPAFPEIGNEVSDIPNGNRIDPGKRFIQ